MMLLFLKHMILVCVIILTLKLGEESYNYLYGKNTNAVQQSPRAPAEFMSPKFVYKVTNKSIQPNFWTESDGMVLPGDTVKLKSDVMRFVLSIDLTTVNLVVDIPRLLDFKITTCAPNDSTRPSLLRIQGRVPPDDYILPTVLNKVLFYKSAHRGRSPRQFQRVIYLPDEWRGDFPLDCEIQNTVVIISCPLKMVMDEDAAGDEIFCSRTSDSESASDEGFPAM